MITNRSLRFALCAALLLAPLATRAAQQPGDGSPDDDGAFMTAAGAAMRRYEMLLREFGGLQTRVTVEAQTRRDAFAAAIKASRDADNLYYVELLSDNGRTVDPSPWFGGVPYVKPDTEPSPLYEPDEDHLRPYELSVEVFGETQGAEYVLAPSRGEALREAVFLEGASDNVQRVVLVAIGKTRQWRYGDRTDGAFWFVDEAQPYGGVMGDLHGEGMDAVEDDAPPQEPELTVPRDVVWPPWMDATEDLCPDGEPHEWSPEWRSTLPASELGHDGVEYRSACRRCRYVHRSRVEGAKRSEWNRESYFICDTPWEDDPETTTDG